MNTKSASFATWQLFKICFQGSHLCGVVCPEIYRKGKLEVWAILTMGSGNKTSLEQIVRECETNVLHCKIYKLS